MRYRDVLHKVGALRKKSDFGVDAPWSQEEQENDNYLESVPPDYKANVPYIGMTTAKPLNSIMRVPAQIQQNINYDNARLNAERDIRKENDRYFNQFIKDRFKYMFGFNRRPNGVPTEIQKGTDSMAYRRSMNTADNNMNGAPLPDDYLNPKFQPNKQRTSKSNMTDTITGAAEGLMTSGVPGLYKTVTQHIPYVVGMPIADRIESITGQNAKESWYNWTHGMGRPGFWGSSPWARFQNGVGDIARAYMYKNMDRHPRNIGLHRGANAVAAVVNNYATGKMLGGALNAALGGGRFATQMTGNGIPGTVGEVVDSAIPITPYSGVMNTVGNIKPIHGK